MRRGTQARMMLRDAVVAALQKQTRGVRLTDRTMVSEGSLLREFDDVTHERHTDYVDRDTSKMTLGELLEAYLDFVK